MLVEVASSYESLGKNIFESGYTYIQFGRRQCQNFRFGKAS
jgi:hypothetical protein